MERDRMGEVYCIPIEKMLGGDESPDFRLGLRMGYERDGDRLAGAPWGSGTDDSRGYLPEATIEQDGQRRSLRLSWGRATEVAEQMRSGATVSMSDFGQGQLYACVMRSLDVLARGGEGQQMFASSYHPQEIAAALYILDRVDDKQSGKAVEEAAQRSEVRGLKEIFEKELRKYGGKRK